MSEDIKRTEKMSVSLKSIDSEAKSSTGSVSKPSTPRSKSDSVKSTKGSVTTRRPATKKDMTDKSTKGTPRKRSLTMTDIRSKIADVVRTPAKQMKKDSCSTTDNSPTSKDVHPAENMLTIRQRELQRSVFAKIYYNHWTKHKNRAENFRDEVRQLQLQKSFLINLRDKESERREEITKVADKQKTEIMDLTEQLSLMTKERKNLQDYFQILAQNYDESIEYIRSSSFDLDKVHDENHKVIFKVQEINELLLTRFISLKQLMHKAQEIEVVSQQHLSMYRCIKHERNEAIKSAQKITRTTELLYTQLKNKEDNERNLKETIKELRQALEYSNARNLDLKSEVKNLELRLDCAEQQLEQQKVHPKTWNIIVQKAAKLSMFILFQFGLLSSF